MRKKILLACRVGFTYLWANSFLRDKLVSVGPQIPVGPRPMAYYAYWKIAYVLISCLYIYICVCVCAYIYVCMYVYTRTHTLIYFIYLYVNNNNRAVSGGGGRSRIGKFHDLPFGSGFAAPSLKILDIHTFSINYYLSCIKQASFNKQGKPFAPTPLFACFSFE